MVWRLMPVMIAVVALSAAQPVAAQSPDATAAYSRGDYTTAYGLWKPLADQGNAYAQFSLGTMYRFGKGVAKDYAAAVFWFRKTADNGLAAAQNNLKSLCPTLYFATQGCPLP
jgi:TPR repeat protein